MEEQRNQLYDILKHAPKCQLHLHLDGSLSFEFIQRSYQRIKSRDPKLAANIYPGNWEPSCLEEAINFAKKTPMSPERRKSFNKPQFNIYFFCNQFLQTPEDICDGVQDIATRLYRHHHVNYLELRLAPHFHTHEGYTLTEIIVSAVKGFEYAQEALDGNLQGGIVICAIRSSKDQCFELLKEIEKNEKILGIDIAGNEKLFPLDAFSEFLLLCKQRNIKTTVHAGEFKDLHANIDSAIEYGVNRIGHALAVENMDGCNIKRLRDANIAIEVILTENCGNAEKHVTFSSHPIGQMIRNGLLVAAFNCDNLLDSGSEDLSPPDPTMECVRALLDCKLSAEEVYKIIQHGYEVGFSENTTKVLNDFKLYWREHVLPKLKEILN